MQLTDIYAMYTHIVGTRDTDFLLWKTEGEVLSGVELRVFADVLFKLMTRSEFRQNLGEAPDHQLN